MDGAQFAKMLSDKHLFELNRMEYKYSTVSVKEFAELLQKNFAQPLKREIEEELDTEIAVEDLIGTIEYDYPAFHLSMDCFWCEVVSGELVLKEAEAARWLTKEEFDSVPWLPADQTILDVIRSSMQPVKPLHTSEYDNEPLQRC